MGGVSARLHEKIQTNKQIRELGDPIKQTNQWRDERGLVRLRRDAPDRPRLLQPVRPPVQRHIRHRLLPLCQKYLQDKALIKKNFPLEGQT